MTEPTPIDGSTKRLGFDLPSIRDERRAAPVSGQVLHALDCDHTESDRHDPERRDRGTEPSKSVGVSPDPVADRSDPDTGNPHSNHSYRAGCEQTSHLDAPLLGRGDTDTVSRRHAAMPTERHEPPPTCAVMGGVRMESGGHGPGGANSLAILGS